MDPLTSWLSQQGAHLAPEGAPLPILTHGDVPKEYASATEGWALFARSNLPLVRIEGGEAQAYLTRILAGDTRGLEEGASQRNMLLSPKGKVLHLFDLTRTENGFRAIPAPGGAAGLMQGLDMYHFGEDIQWHDASSEGLVLEVLGPKAQSGLETTLQVSLDANSGQRTLADWDGGQVEVTPWSVAGHPGWRLIVAPDGALSLWQALTQGGAQPAGLVVFDSLRAESGFAVWGVDIDDSVYPQEARLDDAFSLTKGCYIGQEVVAKIDTYGGLNKRLMLLTLSDDDPVAPGTRLLEAGADGEPRDLGVITTWAYSFALDRAVVLGYVKRKHQALGTQFALAESDRSATIVEFPAAPAEAEPGS